MARGKELPMKTIFNCCRFNWKPALSIVCLVILIGLICACQRGVETVKRNSPQVAEKGFIYPETKRQEVVDDYHGNKVKDPYRWLEKAKDKETIAWVKKQNKLTQDWLAGYKGRDEIKNRLTKLWNFPKYSVPAKQGNRYFFSKNDGLQNQAVVYVQEGLKSEPQVLLDPNKLSADGTIALTNTTFSKDGKFMAYALSRSGSDQQEIKIRRVKKKTDFAEILNWCKFSAIAWSLDGSGFYYNRYPKPGSVEKKDEHNFNRVYWHQLGTPQAEDKLVYEDPANKELGFHPTMSEDGKYLLLHVYYGSARKNRIYYRQEGKDTPFVKLLDRQDAGYHFVGNVGSVFYFQTDLEAPRGKIVAIDINLPGRDKWRQVVDQTEDVISFATMVNRQLVVAYMHHANHRLMIYNLQGKHLQEVKLPSIGSIWALTGKQNDQEMFFNFSSFLFPNTIYRYDFVARKLEIYKQPQMDFQAADYETTQVFYPSKDGTKVPMFITHKKGIKMDGNNPTLLYGYGGFKVDITPYFSIHRLIWLERGGVFAVANLRGGGEYGEKWHQAGMLGNKQNVFDDFIYAGQYLIEKKYTRPARLAINGGSNGGLLVSVCMLQQPKLFGAVVNQVPVTDMLRYHKFTVGHYWTPEYGNAEKNPEHFKFLYAYSPLHNV